MEARATNAAIPRPAGLEGEIPVGFAREAVFVRMTDNCHITLPLKDLQKLPIWAGIG